MRAMRCSGWVIAGASGALALAACGGSSSAGGGHAHHAGAGRSGGAVAVSVSARFPARQRLGQRTTLVIAVRNTGHRALPNVAVSVCDTTCAAHAPAGQGTDAAAFGHTITGTDLASTSRPVWVLNRAPGACGGGCADATGAGGAVTASSNTWALGRLAPGHTARFAWTVTALLDGRHRVGWQVAGDLSGATRVHGAGGAVPRGRLAVTVSRRPVGVRVTGSGRVVTTPG